MNKFPNYRSLSCVSDWLLGSSELSRHWYDRVRGVSNRSNDRGIFLCAKWGSQHEQHADDQRENQTRTTHEKPPNVHAKCALVEYESLYVLFDDRDTDAGSAMTRIKKTSAMTRIKKTSAMARIKKTKELSYFPS
jgi:hypothetical protein